MIEIQDVQTNDIDDIINRLLGEKEQPFEIYVPKSTQTFASSNRDIANDYAMLAFVGQKLNEVADDFTYYYVSPSAHDSVLFEVKTKKIKQLAETILNISYGYSNDSEEDEIYFLDDVYDFIEKVTTGEVISVCPEFIEDYQEYNGYADESEGSDE
jgi:hypothetical protein